MQRAPIVPNQEVAGTPDVLVDEFATLLVVEPAEVELLNYAAAVDQQGMTMVSSAAMAMR